jgi:hypothetical protein
VIAICLIARLISESVKGSVPGLVLLAARRRGDVPSGVVTPVMVKTPTKPLLSWEFGRVSRSGVSLRRRSTAAWIFFVGGMGMGADGAAAGAGSGLKGIVWSISSLSGLLSAVIHQYTRMTKLTVVSKCSL